MIEPGKAFTRLAVSLKPDAMRQLTLLRAHLEKKNGKAVSLSKVVRKSIECLAVSEGIE